MSILHKASDLIAKDFVKSTPNAAFDPSIIFVIADILVQLIDAFKKCKATPPEAVAIAKNPGLFQRVMLRRKILEVVGRQTFREHGNDLIKSFLAVAKTATSEDFTLAYEEIEH
jgi:hypothetical protein